VITDVLFHAAWAAAMTALSAAFAFALWYGLPLYRRRQDRRGGREEHQSSG